MKLLCVEDNATQRRMIDLMLAATGIDVDFAGSGTEALESFQLTAYDAVLMDSGLPDMTGAQAAHHMRQTEAGFGLPPTPMLFLGQPAGDDASGDAYLIKPFTSERLMAALDSLLRDATGSGLQGTLRRAR